MNPRLKKILKRIGIGLLALVIFVIGLIGFVSQFVLTLEKITPRVVHALNENLNADLYLEAVEITFFKTFPSFKLELTEGAIVKPMDTLTDRSGTAQDTLIAFDYAVVSVNPIAFLRDKIKVNRFTFVNPKIYALVTPEGETNWDILKDPDSIEADIDSLETQSEKEAFKASIDLEDIRIVNGELVFDDRYTENYLETHGFDMDLVAQYNEKEILLDLKLDSEDLTIRKEEGVFTDSLSIGLVTDFKVDRASKNIQIETAQVDLNELTFDATGRIQPDRPNKEIDVDLDLELKVPKLNTLIDLIPETIFDTSEKYRAGGQALISAKIEGVYKKGLIPGIRAKMMVNDGSLSYNNKPNQVELIQVDADLYIPPDKGVESNFNIRQMRLKGVGTDLTVTGSGKDIFGRGDLDLTFDGSIDLDALEKTMPFKKDIDLEGLVYVAVKADFNMSDIEKQDYGRIQALGKVRMERVLLDSKSDSLYFDLSKLDLITGQDQNSDLLTSASGKVIGGKVEMSGLNFKLGNHSAGSLREFGAKFATTPLKDTSQVATLKADLLIDEGRLAMGDSLKARIKFLKGDLMLSPKKGEPKTPQISSTFQVDSTGVISKGNKIGLIQARYKLKTHRQGKNWPMEGDISFGTMYAYTPRFPLLIQIPRTEIGIVPGHIELNQAKLVIGQSDITATGRVYNIGEAFLDNGMFQGELEVTSNLIDVNEMIQALNEGAKFRPEQVAAATEEEAEIVPAADSSEPASKEPRSFVVPSNLDLRFESNFKKVLFRRFEIDDVAGLITVKDQKIDLANLQMKTMAANMRTSVAYESKEQGKAAMNFDFLLYEIDLSKLTELLPVIDSLVPMADSFEGKVNFRMKGASSLDKSLGKVGPSLDAIAHIEGDDLVILDGQTYQKIAKMLLFKNKDKNTIDKLQFAMIFQDGTIEVFPSVITVDRYKFAVGGQHKMDMTYDYHISILKSPMPFKAGIDITGTDDDLDFKITKAKYKRLFSTKERQRRKADSTVIKRKIDVMKRLPFYGK